jgi:hypothetical protein
MLEQGIIEKSSTKYYSQVVVIHKPDNKLRICVDFKNLNLISKSTSCPIPNI